MSIERPPAVSPEWCPDCGEEMLFSGTQSAGYAQFFCERCRYRRDRFVGVSVVESNSTGRQTESDDTVEEAQAFAGDESGVESGAD